MTCVTVAITVDQVAWSRRNRESPLAFGTYRHVTDAGDVFAVDVEGEIGTDDCASVTGLVAQDNKWSAQMLLIVESSDSITVFTRALFLERNSNIQGSFPAD